MRHSARPGHGSQRQRLPLTLSWPPPPHHRKSEHECHQEKVRKTKDDMFGGRDHQEQLGGRGVSADQKAAAVVDASPSDPCRVLRCGDRVRLPPGELRLLISKASPSGNQLVTALSASTLLLTCRIA